MESTAAASKNLARSFAKNAFFKAAGEAAIRLLSFAFMVLVARSLGDAQFGVLNFANAFVLLFVVVVDFGLNPLLVRDVAREPGRTSHYFFNFLAIKLLLGLMFLAAVYAGLRWAAPAPLAREVALWLGAFVLLNSFTEFFNSVFNAHQKMQYEAGVMTFQKLALLVLGLLALALGQGLRGVAAAYAAAGLLGTLAAGICLWRARLLGGGWRWDPAMIRYGLKQALPLTLTTLFINLYFRIDMTILTKLRPAAEVGWYGAAHKCIEVLMVVPSVLVVASFPGFSKLFVDDRPRLERAFQKVARLLLLMAAPLVGGSVVVGTPLMALMFGKSFAASGPALAWLSLALGFIFLNFALSYLLIAGGQQKVNAVVAGLAVVVSVAANLFFIPKHGYLGSAAAAAVTECFLFFAYFMAVRKRLFPVHLLDPSLRAVGATVVMMLALWPLRGWNPVLLILLGGLVYAGAGWAFRLVRREDLDLLRKMLKKEPADA